MNIITQRRSLLRFSWLASLAWAFGMLPLASAQADQLVSLTTRAGVQQELLLWEAAPAQPDTVFLILPGGSGELGLTKLAQRVKAEQPYLFSAQRLALLQPGRAVLVLNAPSDQPDLSQSFRLSSAHAEDLGAVVRLIRQRYPAARLVLLAHSRGTLSAGYILQNLAQHISAAVLFAGLYQASDAQAGAPSAGPGLSWLNWSEIKTPVLAVHHVHDACPVAPYAAAQASGLALITVQKKVRPTAEFPCGPGTYHWFAGQEQAIAKEVSHWLAGQTWRRTLP